MAEEEDLGTTQSKHIVFLHHRLRKRPRDRYIVDLAIALQDAGHTVSIYTSECDRMNCFQEVNCKLDVFYSTWWIPMRFKFLKSIVMAFRMIFFPPKPRPDIIFLDIHAVAVYLISLLSKIKTIYVTHFTSLNHLETFTKFMKIKPDLTTCIGLQQADVILVQSDGLADVFHRSFPTVKKEIKILPPCVDTGLWCENTINLDRIIPDISKRNFVFVCFGTYLQRSNFKMILDAFEDLILISDKKYKDNIHLVIAGHFTDMQIDEKMYYQELLQYAKEKTIASQVTFLRQLPTIHKKTLIQKATGIILPGKYDVFPETILAVLVAGRPIIAVNSGFARESLKHRLSGILVEPLPQQFASAMHKLLINPAIQIFLCESSRMIYQKNYTNSIFRRKINNIVSDCIRCNRICGIIH